MRKLLLKTISILCTCAMMLGYLPVSAYAEETAPLAEYEAEQPAETQPDEGDPEEVQPGEAQPEEVLPADRQPAEEQPAEKQPAEQQPVEQPVAKESEEGVPEEKIPDYPTFEVGRGMSGMISRGKTTGMTAHAGKRGKVRFTLTLDLDPKEESTVRATFEDADLWLSRRDGDSHVYTFVRRFQWNEKSVITLTADKDIRYTIRSELLPEEPAEQQEPAVEVETPSAETATESEDSESEKPVEPETVPETTEAEGQQTVEETAVAEEEAEPAEQTENKEEEQQETDEPEEAAESIEIIIAKELTPDESWSGTVRNSKPTILKLDVASARTIHMLVKGKDVCYSVQKSDRLTDDAAQVLTDSKTNQSITSWSAEAGSYLISIKAGESSLMAKVAVSFMNDEELEAWEAEQAVIEIEENIEEEILEEPVEENEAIPEETGNEPESEPERSIELVVTWDTEEPEIGSTAHVEAELTGYDDVIYSIQWQYSPDAEHWTDAMGENGTAIDVTLTEENDNYYWRIVVYVEEPVK